jgi:hypothetical protein
LLESDDAFPEFNHSGAGSPPVPGRIALYVDRDGACVIAECFKEYGRSTGGVRAESGVFGGGAAWGDAEAEP